MLCAYQIDASNPVLLFFSVFFGTVWFHNRVALRRTLYIILYQVPGMYLHTECCCCRCCCCGVAILLLQQQCWCFLLLFVIVCRMAKFVADLLNLIPVFSFSSFKRDLFLLYPLAVLSRLRPRFAYILGNYGHERSQGGVSPPRRSPPCILYVQTYKRGFTAAG